VNQKSLIDSLKDCTYSCGWCITNCPDEDKYEMLVTCINIQKEIVQVGNIVYRILSDRFFKTMKIITILLETFAAEIQKRHITVNYNFNAEHNSGDNRRLPGCSQIFTIAQSLEGIFDSEILRYDSD